MKIAIITPWYSENMGYSENLLPKALAQLGHDVHLVTSTAQIYFNDKIYKKVYEPYLGPAVVSECRKKLDGYMFYRLPLKKNRQGFPGIKGLKGLVSDINPQVVQTFDLDAPPTIEIAEYCETSQAKLFTECHIHASIFRKNGKKSIKEALKSMIAKYNKRQQRVINIMTLCYPIAEDAAEITSSFYNVPFEKIKIQSLGVDADLFDTSDKKKYDVTREKVRSQLGFEKNEIVCIYTGRFTNSKNPFCLAKAISSLSSRGKPFKGLFVGNGDKKSLDYLRQQKGCVVHPFVKVNELPKFYWAADVGVWPRQESTSQLDAMASSLPIILSNTIKVLERVTDNGFLYEEDSETDLVKKIEMLTDPELRMKMGEIGRKKVKEHFSWKSIACERLKDYKSL